eukprot:Colp12_sorted_trinity150504_noHs@34781
MAGLNIPTESDKLVWDLYVSRHLNPTICAAVKLGLFDFIKNNPGATVEDVVTGLKFGRRGAQAVLNVLAVSNFVVRHGKKHFLSVAAETFLTPGEFYWGNMLTFHPSPMVAEVESAILKDACIGTAPDWETGNISYERAKSLSAAFHSHSVAASLGVARNPVLKSLGFKHFLDVGAGSGCFCISMAKANSDVKCTVLDLPEVCRVAEDYIKEGGVSGQVSTHPCNMFAEALPNNIGADAIFFSNIFHDWTDEQNTVLATKAFNALPSGGHILLHEMLLGEDGGPLTAALFSITMLLYTRGKQYTFHELKTILEAVGFVDVSVVPTYGYYSVVFARKP